MSLKKFIKYLLCLFFFLLPWQTRWIYAPAELNNGFWEYGTLSLYGTEILLWLIVLLFLIDKLRDKERRAVLFSKELFQARRGRLFFVLMFLCFFALLIANSLNPQISWQYLVRLLGVFCLAVVIVAYCHSEGFTRGISTSKSSEDLSLDACLPVGMARDDKGLMISLWLGGVVQGLLALYQFFTQNVIANKWLGMSAQSAKDLGASVIEFGLERWLRAYGSFGSPNILGVYLGVVLIFGLILYIKIEKPFYKLLITIGQLFILSGLILSFSRASWLATVVGMVVLISFPTRATLADKLKRWKDVRFSFLPKRKTKGMAVTCGQSANPPLPRPSGELTFAMTVLLRQLFYYLLVVILFFVALQPLFLARFNTANRLEVISLNERKTQLTEFKDVFFANWFLGVGPGVYTLALFQEDNSGEAWQYRPVHNIYLLFLAEWGIVGIIFLVGLIYWAVRTLEIKNIFYLPILFVLAIAGLFDHSLISLWSGLIIFGAVIFLSIKIKNKI